MMREIVLDTETTGLDPNKGDRLIEIGCIELYNRIPTGREFHRFVNPERDAPAEAGDCARGVRRHPSADLAVGGRLHLRRHRGNGVDRIDTVERRMAEADDVDGVDCADRGQSRSISYRSCRQNATGNEILRL